ncbi:MAG TPA: hypothetical protein PLD20_08135 [Blastocatellia bacterium]|nr:hypothetical protein [Blastocatellia bacterium]HMV85029.1 hypothetical protein [Blastocatellia bacterium]HMZ17882.1 hypothetical protein [Blastocatellia bacterium]HNG30907.1 hypothetical protein [Blastocatellia bacterium]
MRFAAGKVIDRQESQLKEYVIATEVFGRNDDFDPRIDSTVRVQASRLRTKLAEYYSTEGKTDRVLIDLPKGQYAPIFSYAAVVSTNDPSQENAAEVKQPPQNTEKAQLAVAGAVPTATAPAQEFAGTDVVGNELASLKQRRWQMLAMALALLTVLFGISTIFYRSQTLTTAGMQAVSLETGNDSLNLREIEPLWGGMLRSAQPVLVVYSNTLFQGTAENGMKLLKSLDSPGSSIGSPIIPQTEIEQSKQPVIEHYTGIGEVMGAFQLGELFAKLHHPARVKRSLLLNWEDLKTENIVVLGSPAENLFLRDLPQRQEFVFKPMPDDQGKQSFGIVNLRPQPGEQTRYFAKQDGPSRSQISEDYAVISLLQGLNGDKRMLILAGITTLGTQAAAEYVTKPDYIRDLVQRLNTSPAGQPPKLPENYQVLVKVKVNGGVPAQISYLTHHVL